MTNTELLTISIEPTSDPGSESSLAVVLQVGDQRLEMVRGLSDIPSVLAAFVDALTTPAVDNDRLAACESAVAHVSDLLDRVAYLEGTVEKLMGAVAEANEAVVNVLNRLERAQPPQPQQQPPAPRRRVHIDPSFLQQAGDDDRFEPDGAGDDDADYVDPQPTRPVPTKGLRRDPRADAEYIRKQRALNAQRDDAPEAEDQRRYEPGLSGTFDESPLTDHVHAQRFPHSTFRGAGSPPPAPRRRK